MRGAERGADGYTLLELMIVLALAATLAAVTASGFRTLVDSASISAATRVVHQHVLRARAVAVYGRCKVRLRKGATAELELVDARDSVLASVRLTRAGPLGIDSFRVRPASLRFNPRGQAAPGSIYLYRGRKGARVVVNFLGRVRVQRFVAP